MKNVNKKNTMIAEFLGHKVIGTSPGTNGKEQSIYNIETVHCKGYAVDGMKYHSSWDWLMPVVEKIEEIDNHYYDCKIEGNDCVIQNYDHSQIIAESPAPITGDIPCKLLSTWGAVCEFIIWFNLELNK